MTTMTKKIPDDIFKIIFEFVGDHETCAWTAYAVQTNNSIAPWLLRFCHDKTDRQIEPNDRFWANERMLHIVQTQHIEDSFNDIRLEDAIYLCAHQNDKSTARFFDYELLRIYQELEIKCPESLVDNVYWIVHICSCFFGLCNFKNRMFIQRRLFEVCGDGKCVLETCECRI